MQVYYCSSCGKRIPLEEIEEGRALEIDGQMYCAECVDAQTPEATAVEDVEAVPEGPVYCDRCNALIDPANFESGKAVRAGGQSYCAKCTAMYLPLLEALKEKESHTVREEPVHHRRRTPAYGMRAVASERQAEQYAPAGYEGFEKKSSATAIIAIVGIVLVLIIILAVVMSSSTTRKPPDRGGSHPIVQPPGPGTGPPPPPGPDRPQETPKYVEDPRVKTAIEAAESFAKLNPEAYVAIINRYEQIKRDFSLSTFQSSHVEGAINATYERRRNRARETRDKVLKKAEALVKKDDYPGAIAALQKYPDKFKEVKDCWDTIQDRINQLDKDLMAKTVFNSLVSEVDKFKKEKKEEEGIDKLKKFMKDYAGSSFVTKAHDMLTELEKIIEDRKAVEEEAKRKAADALAKAKDTLQNSEPLYYVDFTAKELNTNIKVKHTLCEYPYLTQQGINSLRFMQLKATATMEFSLLGKPKFGLLQVTHVIPQHTDQESYVMLTLELNGKTIVKDKRYDRGQAEEKLQFDVADKLVKGKNQLKISFPSGTVRWDLHKVALKAYYEGAGWQTEKTEADIQKKTAQDDYTKWRAAEKRKAENERKKLARKFERGALPALKPGTHNLLKNKSMKGWKIWGKGGEWKIENGVLVGRNNNLSWGSMITPHFKGMDKWQNYTLSFKIKFENSCENRLFLRTSYPDAEDKIPLDAITSTAKAGAAQLGTLFEAKYVIEGNKMNSWINGNQNANNFEIAPRMGRGFFGWHIGPNATLHISEVILELKKTK